MTQPDDESMSAEPQRADPQPATARAVAEGEDKHGAARARAWATVHVSTPRPDRAELLAAALALGTRDDESLLRVGRRIDRQLGRLAATTLVLAGAVLGLAVVVALGACA